MRDEPVSQFEAEQPRPVAQSSRPQRSLFDDPWFRLSLTGLLHLSGLAGIIVCVLFYPLLMVLPAVTLIGVLMLLQAPLFWLGTASGAIPPVEILSAPRFRVQRLPASRKSLRRWR